MVTAGAVLAMLLMAALALVALNARNEAQRQRAEAEGLIEFMLTDLRDRLRGVGRLDVMTAVNRRALAYYGGQQALGGISPASLERRARVLHAMGEDDFTRGNLDAALVAFREAHRTTAKNWRVHRTIPSGSSPIPKANIGSVRSISNAAIIAARLRPISAIATRRAHESAGSEQSPVPG